MSVDHEARRRKIAEVTASVIWREGLEAATIRRIAAELGGPTKTVTYYFADKQELLRFTWEFLAQQYFEQVSAHKPTDIVGRLMAMAASDEKGLIRWRTYAAFLDQAARDPVIAQLQRQHTQAALTLIGDTIHALGIHHDIDRIALMLNVMVQGISVQALADHTCWPVERIRDALTHQVEMLLGQRLPDI